MEAVIGILTVSDSRTAETDESGPAVEAALRALGYDRFRRFIVKDQRDDIRTALLDLAPVCDAIFTSGGTGFGPRDVTPDVTAPLLDRRADSLCELMRLRGLEKTPLSHVSRGVAGIIGNTLVVNLPGSPKAAREGIEALIPLLEPILLSLAGERCPHFGDSASGG